MRPFSISRSLVFLLVVFMFGWMYDAHIQRDQLHGCREVLNLLERPGAPASHVDRHQYVPGTKIYQDMEQ